MLEETGEKIFCLSQDTGKQSGNISTPAGEKTYFSHSPRISLLRISGLLKAPLHGGRVPRLTGLPS